jgi:hypothetical protein
MWTPALASDPDTDVAAWWGQRTDHNLPSNFQCGWQDGSCLMAATHQPHAARGWTSLPVIVYAADGDVDTNSRPALAWLPDGAGNQEWFIAYLDVAYGIQVVPLPVPHKTTVPNPIPVPRVTLTTPVAFAAMNSNTLVLAFGSTDDHGNPVIRIMTSSNLQPFVPTGGTIALESGSPLPSVASSGTFAPYLASSATGILLAVARAHAAGSPANDIRRLFVE